MTITEAFERWYARPRLTPKMIRDGDIDPLSSRENAERAFRAGVRWERDQANEDRIAAYLNAEPPYDT